MDRAIETLKNSGIEKFIYTDSGSGALDAIIAFVEAGFKVVETKEVAGLWEDSTPDKGLIFQIK